MMARLSLVMRSLHQYLITKMMIAKSRDLRMPNFLEVRTKRISPMSQTQTYKTREITSTTTLVVSKTMLKVKVDSET